MLLAAAGAQSDVRIVGVEGAVADNVLAHLDLDDEPCDAPERRIAQRLRAAPAQVRSALEAFGYYAPEIATQSVPREGCWHVELTIDPGPRVVLRRVDVAIDGEAADDPAFAAIRAAPGLAPGAPLEHAAYEELKRRLVDLAAERGYAEARFDASRIDVYPAELAADVTLRFDSGPRYRFGPIVLEQDVLSERMVRSYLGFEPGEPYDNRRLAALYVELSESGYFSSIDVRPEAPDDETRTIPVRIALAGAPRRLITYGAGFSTDTGPRVTFGRTNRRWNDRGHQFGVSAQLSPVTSEVTANYRFPFGDPRFQWVSFDAGARREVTDTSESEGLEISARRVFERPGAWTRTELVTWLIEDFEVADQVGRSRILMPAIDWMRLRADNTIRPRRGSKIDIEVRGGSDRLGSDTSFLQTIVEGKWIWSAPSSARFIVRTRAGVTWEREFEQLPPSVRFFAGGDNSVRGYSFESLGPADEDGRIIGGAKLLTASFEYEHPLKGRWGLAAFVDSGNAFNGSSVDARTGAGLGGRWQSPLGPVRLDLAVPLDDEDRSFRVHVSLGPDL